MVHTPRWAVLAGMVCALAGVAAMAPWEGVLLAAGLPAIEPPGARVQTAQGEPMTPIPAGAAVLVVDPHGAGLPADPANVERRIRNHVALISTEQTLSKAIMAEAVRKTSWFTKLDDPRKAVEFLRKNLRVAAVPGSELISVSLENVGSGSERAVILRVVCDAYLKMQRDARNEQLLDRTMQLNNRKIKVEMGLRDLRAEIRNVQLRVNADGGALDRVGVKQRELESLIPEKLQAEFRLGESVRRHDAALEAVRVGEGFDELDQALASDARLIGLQRQLDEAEARKVVTAQDKPAQAAAEAMIKWVGPKIEARRTEVRQAVLRDVQTRQNAERTRVEVLARRIDNLESDVGDLAVMQQQLRRLEQEEQEWRQQRVAIVRELELVMSQQSSPGSAEVRWQLLPDGEMGR